MNTLSNRMPLATVVLSAILIAAVGGGGASIATAQLGWHVTAWALWSVNLAGVVILLVLGAAALANAILHVIRYRGFSAAA